MRYLARSFNSGKDNIHIRDVMKISSDRVLVRVNTDTAAAAIKDAVVLKDCVFSEVTKS